MSNPIHRHFANLVSFFIFSSVSWAATDTVVILHTNDIHDHVLPGYNGIGGMPYVSGYIKSVKARRDDVFVLDAGDAAEKGDLVAFLDRSRITYKAMARIGYDAGAPGNHEYDTFGISGLIRFERLSGMDILCLNLLTPNGHPELTPSKIYDVDGVKIAVIGLIVPRKALCLNAEESALALAREAEKLEDEAHLIVALCHVGSRACRQLSQVAKTVDIFVAGHTHEELHEPLIVKETGALILQAGDYSRMVGKLELEIDLESEEIVQFDGELIAMRHNMIPADEEMLAWLRAEEARLCPESGETIGFTEVPIMHLDVGWLAANAMREYSQADVAFCKTEKVIRGYLPRGSLDVNAVFRTGSQRAHQLIRAQLTGAEIEAYLNALAKGKNGLTQWSGFTVDVKGRIDEAYRLTAGLEPDRYYDVVMPKLEWTDRFKPAFDRARREKTMTLPPERKIGAAPVPFSFTDAVARYVRERDFDAENSLLDHIHSLVAAQTSGDWDLRMAVPSKFRHLVPAGKRHDGSLRSQ